MNMKVLMFLCFIIATIKSVRPDLIGERCSRFGCTSKMGHISFSNPDPSLAWQITGDSQLLYKDFVVTIKNIKLRSASQYTWMYINGQTIFDDQNYVFVFERISYLQVLIDARIVISFDLEYTSGCKILQEANANFEKTMGSPQPQPQSTDFWILFFQQQQQQQVPAPTCWVLIPQRPAVPGIMTSEILQTYVAFENISLSNNASIKATNILGSDTTFSVNGSITNAITKINKSNSTAQFRGSAIPGYRISTVEISTIILIDLECSNATECDETQFTATSSNLQQKDMACIKENQCRMNIIDTVVNCPTQLPGELYFSFMDRETAYNMIEANCPAFDLYLSELFYSLSFEEEEEEEESSGIEGRSWIAIARYCKLSYVELFCRVKQCNVLYKSNQKCRSLCLYVKHSGKFCEYNHSYFGR